MWSVQRKKIKQRRRGSVGLDRRPRKPSLGWHCSQELKEVRSELCRGNNKCKGSGAGLQGWGMQGRSVGLEQSEGGGAWQRVKVLLWVRWGNWTLGGCRREGQGRARGRETAEDQWGGEASSPWQGGGLGLGDNSVSSEKQALPRDVWQVLDGDLLTACTCMCLCVCVWERERECMHACISRMWLGVQFR